MTFYLQAKGVGRGWGEGGNKSGVQIDGRRGETRNLKRRVFFHPVESVVPEHHVGILDVVYCYQFKEAPPSKVRDGCGLICLRKVGFNAVGGGMFLDLSSFGDDHHCCVLLSCVFKKSAVDPRSCQTEALRSF